ncbi:MAG: hypothetical protein ACRC0G_03600 [Fusobacteriaceae bacterium]
MKKIKVVLLVIIKVVFIVLNLPLKAKTLIVMMRNEDLQEYVFALVMTPVIPFLIKGNFRGAFYYRKRFIKIYILDNEFVDTLIHECVHAQQWARAIHRAKRDGVVPTIELGVNYTTEFYEALEKARAEVKDLWAYDPEHCLYWVSPEEVEARMVAAKAKA